MHEAIIGNKIARWYADIVLAKNGISGQQTDEPASPDRKNNVWEPVREDRGAYGNFAAITHNKSYTLWAGMHRNLLRLVAGVATGAMLIALTSRKTR